MKYFFADLETDMIEAEKYLEVKTCAMVGEGEEYFTTDIEEFIEIILGKFSRTDRPIVYFHNLQYDFAFLFKEMVLKKMQKGSTEFIVRGSQLIGVKFYVIQKSYDKRKNRKRTRRRCIGEIRDSYALLPTSLFEIGRNLGFEKGEIDFENCSFEELKEYNLRDCYLLEKAIKSFISDVEKEYEIEITAIPLTISSFSRTIMKKFYGTDYTLNNVWLNEYFRKWYFGGRVEVFDFNVWEKVKDYDINSLYPYVMHKYKYTQDLVYKETTKKYDELSDYDFVALECLVNEKGYLPLIPERVEGKLVFREGIKRCLLWKEEIDYLLGVGQIDIISITKVYQGDRRHLFKDFVKKAYKLRKRTDKRFYNLIFKIILVSSYGKFAEKTEKEQISIKPLEEMTKEDLKFSREEIDGKFILRTKKTVKLNLNVPIACKITAMGRLELHKHMMKTINKGGKLIYCDTDSIFTDGEYYDEKEVLGEMKLEADIEKLICLNAKEYAYDNKITGRIKMKGFINREGSVEEFLKIYLKPFFIPRKTTFKECIKKYNEDNEYFRFVELKEKRKKTFYCKRVILKDGSTRPMNTKELPSEIEERNKKIIMEMYFNGQSKYELVRRNIGHNN
jgi:hypothetical protein